MKSTTQSGPTMRYRLAVLSRIAAAIGGGYALAGLCTALLAAWLPMARADAVMTATMLSFSIHACAVIWVFAARDAWRAWIGLGWPTLALAAAYWLGRGAS
ncbi:MULTISPECIES: DUF3649 domain-containing protein [unclassified Herbaspirillum]|uniref:DUF3649 domain-containing protein n=1 Tax=unclassified Herbaspirillum TaxID=2624150 RepID=UPI001154896B|nr:MULTISPECIES: DUF3649 domain-containing protein [unclassified Herbaspirillum]MBB5391982.1 hypothetical protein [Herbaspirillum sp. SJZ102]TQK13442.1 uncharacterized protein DUF3649 [Herbaspirillum sp. SJZ130]TQK15446.1 uncharacterized protein DUF3649 [Herbaspirillum sp. SJZ106]TWC71341.1 uncharacterized protein DUF3649 [Herbaspirillum sp. SJZ099]